MKSECIQKTKDRLIVFNEKRSKLTFINSDRVAAIKITVDGCQITEGIKCDYLLIAKEVEHFIELKGQDINHAIEQIKATIRALSSNAFKGSKVSYVICTRSPLSTASLQNIQLKFKREFNSTLIVRSSPFELGI